MVCGLKIRKQGENQPIQIKWAEQRSKAIGHAAWLIGTTDKPQNNVYSIHSDLDTMAPGAIVHIYYFSEQI